MLRDLTVKGSVAMSFGFSMGQNTVPRDVTHARIDPSVKVIRWGVFTGCSQLEVVELCEGLDRIEGGAFNCCKSLKYFKVPSTVKKIEEEAFRDCIQLVR